MFENYYTVDVKRYIGWYAPPAAKRRGFKLWMGILALSAVMTLIYSQCRGQNHIHRMDADVYRLLSRAVF